MPSSSPGPDEPSRAEGHGDVPAVSEEEWVRFQREASDAGVIRSAPKEPSARARMVARRLRRLDEEAAARSAPRRRWGRRKKEPEPWQPEGWRTGPAWQKRKRPDYGRWVAGAVALAVLGWGVTTQLGGWDFDFGAPDAPEAPLAAETAAPSTAPEDPALADAPTLEAPYAGSPAERWAEGADAIELPAARAVGDVSASEVGEGLEQLKAFLVAANLAPEVLEGGRPEQAVSLVDPGQSELLEEMGKALDEPSERYDPRFWFSRFDSEEVRQIVAEPRVRGRVEVTEREDGQAALRADYTFVYPVESRARPGEVTRSVIRRAVEVHVADPDQWQSRADRLWIREYAVEFGNEACGRHDGFLHPEFLSDRMNGPRPTGPATDPYDRSGSLDQLQQQDIGAECGTASRV